MQYQYSFLFQSLLPSKFDHKVPVTCLPFVNHILSIVHVYCETMSWIRPFCLWEAFHIYICLLQVAWAPGIGVKESAFKDKWEVDVGATYIPWSSLPDDLSGLTEGGIIDEDSLPENLKGLPWFWIFLREILFFSFKVHV